MNQCQGCQRGWPTVQTQLGKMHRVNGGYQGELCACSAHLYAEDYKREFKELLAPEDFEKVVKAINEPPKENKKLREKLKRNPLWEEGK